MTDAPSPSPGELLCVVTIGRSGSTLLQRLLNLHDQVVVFGEHNAMFGTLRTLWGQLFQSWASETMARSSRLVPDLLASRPVMALDGASIEWANAFTEATALPTFRRFAEDLLFPPALRPSGLRYWGFKEIRYGAPVLVFLTRLFPEARFLVLLRDPVAIHASRMATGYWYPRLTPEEAARTMHQEWRMLCDAWDMLRDRQDGRSMLLSYDALPARPQAVMDGIAAWAGLPPFDPGRVAAVVAAPGRSAADADPARTARFMAAYDAATAAEDAARWRALAGG